MSTELHKWTGPDLLALSIGTMLLAACVDKSSPPAQSKTIVESSSVAATSSAPPPVHGESVSHRAFWIGAWREATAEEEVDEIFAGKVEDLIEESLPLFKSAVHRQPEARERLLESLRNFLRTSYPLACRRRVPPISPEDLRILESVRGKANVVHPDRPQDALVRTVVYCMLEADRRFAEGQPARLRKYEQMLRFCCEEIILPNFRNMMDEEALAVWEPRLEQALGKFREAGLKQIVAYSQDFLCPFYKGDISDEDAADPMRIENFDSYLNRLESYPDYHRPRDILVDKDAYFAKSLEPFLRSRLLTTLRKIAYHEVRLRAYAADYWPNMSANMEGGMYSLKSHPLEWPMLLFIDSWEKPEEADPP